MKIFMLPVRPEFQPATQNYVCPPHNEQWNVETDFLRWLRSSDLTTDNQGQADWDYLSVYWNRRYVNLNWGQDGVDDLQREIERLVNRNRRVFTICEYDLRQMQPKLELFGMQVFTASRRTEDSGIDIPLLCTPHPLPAQPPDKKWRASFVGNAGTFNTRLEMREKMSGLLGVNVLHEQMGSEFFRDLMLTSWIGLAPRGHGAQSFRFYEAMQLGTVPLYISDMDCRPFGRWIDWSECSLHAYDVDEAIRLLDEHTADAAGIERLRRMGWWARQVYEHDLAYGQWCRFVVRELQCLA